MKNARKQSLHVSLDLHEYNSMGQDPSANKEKFLTAWRQISARYQDAPESILFEILNEPSGELNPALWNEYLAAALVIIREKNPTRIVIVGPAFHNSIAHLSELQVPEKDRNIIVTVHYYIPEDFTHQGAVWAEPKRELGVAWLGTKQEREVLDRDFDKAA